MNRRGFLRSIAVAAVSLAVNPADFLSPSEVDVIFYKAKKIKAPFKVDHPLLFIDSATTEKLFKEYINPIILEMVKEQSVLLECIHSSKRAARRLAITKFLGK